MKWYFTKIPLFFTLFFIFFSVYLRHIGNGKERGEMTTIKIFYIPFDVGTYLPVTPENIEDQAQCIFKLSSKDSDIKTLKDILEASKSGSFIDKLVRLKVVSLYSKDVYVDFEGGMKKGSNELEKLTEQSFSKLKLLTKRWEKTRQKECRYVWGK